MGKEELVLIVQAEGEEEQEDRGGRASKSTSQKRTEDKRRSSSPASSSTSKSGYGYALLPSHEQEEEEQEEQEDRLAGGRGGSVDRKAKQQNKVVARRGPSHQTHSRGSSGESVKFVSDASSASAGATPRRQRTPIDDGDGASEDDCCWSEDERGRVIILSASCGADEEEEEIVTSALDVQGVELEEEDTKVHLTASNCVGVMGDTGGSTSKDYGSFQNTASSPARTAATTAAAAAAAAAAGGEVGRMTAAVAGAAVSRAVMRPAEPGGGGRGDIDDNQRLLQDDDEDGGAGGGGDDGARAVSREDSGRLAARSDSCSSDDEVGTGNSSGYTRHKSRKRHHRGGNNQGHGGGNVDDVQIDMEDVVDEGSQQPLEGEIPREVHKTVLSFLFFFCGAVATTTSLALTHERVPDDEPLPDAFLDNVNYQVWGLNVSEVLIMAASIATFTLCVFHGNRFVVLRRVFFLGGLHYFYRAITMFVTVLPKPNTEYICLPKSDHLTFSVVALRVLKLLSGFGLSINGEHVFCGDYIYSGHTMTLVMTYLIVHEYSPRRWYLLHWLSWCVTAFGILVLLLARGHYSIDVVIAYWITTRLWWVYHTLANNPSLVARENKENFLDRFWWWPIFSYLEGNVGRPLPKTFNWPLPEVVVTRVRETVVRFRASRAAASEADGSSEPAIPPAAAASTSGGTTAAEP